MIRKRNKLKKYRKVYFLPEKDGQMKERSEMLMSELLTNFKDDILAESMEGRRRYQMITNEDGTVSFVDVTEYEQIGSEFGQAEVNAIHREINRKFDSGDVVDPLVAEEAGFAADAKLTGDALREVSAKIDAKNTSDGILKISASKSKSVSIGAVSSGSVSLDFTTSGYKPVAIYSVSSNQQGSIPYGIILSGNTLHINLRNTSTSNVSTVTVSAKVLLAKDESIEL